eukprot:g613.t1
MTTKDLSTSTSVHDVLIHDVRETIECRLSSKKLLQLFLKPDIVTETKSRELHQPDGSVEIRHLPEKLRRLPRELLYDTTGLEVFEQMNQLEDEYYLAACEIALIREHIAEIAFQIPDNASIIDLGCGSMVKTKIIVDHLRKIGKRGIRVYGVDIDGPYLRSTLSDLLAQERAKKSLEENRIHYEGILGTYEQSIQFIKELNGPKVLLFLGFTIGNYDRAGATRFLNMFREEVLDTVDSFFVGFDKRNDPRVVARAYNDSAGLFQKRMRDGIDHLNKILGGNIFQHDNFAPLSGYNSIEGANERYYKSLRDQVICIPPPFSGHESEQQEVVLKEGEIIHLMDSFKYSQQEIHEVVSAAGLMVAHQWTDPRKMIRLCLLKKCQEEE